MSNVDLSMEVVRAYCDMASDFHEEWQGFPVPSFDDEIPLVLAHDHPLRAKYIAAGFCGPQVNVIVDDRPEYNFDPLPADADIDAIGQAITRRVDEERFVNSWWCRQRQCVVYVVDRGGRRFSLVAPKSPDRSMDRLDLWLRTLGASDAWDVDAEHAARDTLRAMLTDRQWRHYDLTGTFLETSARSRLTYVFRRLRPTVALTPRGKRGQEHLRVLAVLCMHPIGYYAQSWAGCMVPSDDVIAHLTFMRGDEAGFWKQANQHDPANPEAGL